MTDVFLLMLKILSFCLLFVFPLSGAASQYHHPYRSPLEKHMYRTWSEWTAWSVCSRTCGGGVRTRTRICKARFFTYNTNLPKTCFGETTQYDLCKKQSCPADIEDFWSFQCSQHNGQVLGSRLVEEWLPYMNVKTPCELQCLSRERDLLYRFGKVIDGTRCKTSHGESSSGICVNGRCTNIDCSGQLGLDNRLDKCGVCRGDNSSCVHYRNSYWSRPRPTQKNHLKSDPHYDYNRIVEIPIGATHVLIRENTENNFLAIMDESGKLLVNGNWKVGSPGHFKTDQGFDLIYSRTSGGRESLSIPGPTEKNFLVLVLGKGNLPTVDYEYWYSKLKTHPSTKIQHFKSFYTLEYPSRNTTTLSESRLNYGVPEAFVKPQEEDRNPHMKGYKSYYHQNKIIEYEPSYKFHNRHKTNIIIKAKSNHIIHSNVHRADPVITSADPSYSTPVSIVSKHHDLTFGEKHHYHIEEKELITEPRSHHVDVPSRLIQSKPWDGRPNGTMHMLDGRKSVSRSANSRKPPKRNVDENERIILSTSENSELSEYLKGKKQKFTKKRKREKEKQKKEKCKPCPKAKKARRNLCASDFVLRAAILASDVEQAETRYEIEVIQSYKNKVPILTKEYIWTPELCKCPRLRVGEEYIVMGRLDVTAKNRESRLIVDRNSFVRRYTKKRARTMQLLARDQVSVCKR